jgi:diguanylate cyclase (GGDEF)-like protein
LTKRIVFAAAIVLATSVAAGAAAPAPLTTLHAAATLSNAEGRNGLPVSFEATVTYFRSSDKDLFVQEGGDAIYVHANTSLKLTPGDRIRVTGTMHDSFRPYVESNDILRLGHGALPKPEHPSFAQMIRSDTDCKFVTVQAFVLSADLVPDRRSPTPTTFLRMTVDGAPADASVDSEDENALKDLLGSEVEITGAVSGEFDNKMQQTGILFHIQSLDGVKILKHANSDPWSLPVTPMDRIISGYQTANSSERLRVQGTITYYEPGTALVLQDGSKSLWIATESYSPLRIGNLAGAIGFPDVQNGFLTLTRSEVRDSSIQAPVAPTLFTWRELALGGNEGHGHVFDLVSVEGQVVTEVRQATEDEYVIDSDGHLFSAILRHPVRLQPATLAPMRGIPPDTRIRVTGICMLTDANPFNGEVPFNILMRGPDDIQVVAQPPWLNLHHLRLIVGLLIAMVFVMGMREWLLGYKNRRNIVSLAYLEQRRARILEDINHSRPLAGILERITELVSVRLNGAACWCHVAEGATLGNRPSRLSTKSLRTVEFPIPSRSGQTLGSLLAAFDARTRPRPAEQEALAMAAALATLAIETSRLYTDLVYRSEFDLLTDVQNRFVMEKKLVAMIQAARQSAGVFGLIYIDLDQFKRVNDVHGHMVGDLYLQEAAQRMKRQLRPGDTLARLGGDEFAVLVPVAHSRGEVEEIAERLEFSFHEPFVRDGCVIQGSASVGVALYPEDAESVETLLSAADASMYVAKHTRVGKSRTREVLEEDELVNKDRS